MSRPFFDTKKKTEIAKLIAFYSRRRVSSGQNRTHGTIHWVWRVALTVLESVFAYLRQADHRQAQARD
jgi:hypothetical protein